MTGARSRRPRRLSRRPGGRRERRGAGWTPGHNLPWLYAGRALRSLSTTFLGVITPLYLARIGYSGATVGTVFTLASVMVAAQVVAVGVTGDRFGRRRVLVGLALLGAAGSALLAVSGSLVPVTLGCGAAAVGRGGGAGGGGGWGPVFPAEQPLLAASVTDRRRTAVFARIGFIGVLAGATGAAVAMAPSWLHAAGWAWATSYRLLFGVAAVTSLAMAAVSLPLRDPAPTATATDRPPPAAPGGTAAAGRGARPRLTALSTRQLISRLALTNGLNGLGIGFLGPILVYWLYRRFGAGPGQVGVLFALANLLAALPYLGVARLVRRIGAVRVVVGSRLLSVLFLLSMAWVPTFPLAALAFILRSGVNSLNIPARQSYVMGVAAEGSRGTVAALGGLPSQATASISPYVAGALMNGFLDVPIYGAALFLTANTVGYWLSFRHVRPPEEARAETPAASSAPAGAGPG